MNFAKTLSRKEMKNIMAGGADPEVLGETKTCKEFHKETGCYPAPGGNTCEGNDGHTYAAATSSGSCTG